MNYLPIPDAESLPFYPLVLKLVVRVWNDQIQPQGTLLGHAQNLKPHRISVKTKDEVRAAVRVGQRSARSTAAVQIRDEWGRPGI